MTLLSVNINKVATLRNARGGNIPNLLEVTKDLQRFGAQGITIHPRPDQRHIRYEDAFALSEGLTKEFNIEGNPIPKFIEMVLDIKPDQVTLVPDGNDVLTSNAGWDTSKNIKFLTPIIKVFKDAGIRTSIFVDPDIEMIEGALNLGSDRIELYTAAANKANEIGLGINAGHDLNLDNIAFFAKNIPGLLEVSIGHALMCESLYLGFENVIPMYLQRLSS